jgi:gluconolactonase
MPESDGLPLPAVGDGLDGVVTILDAAGTELLDQGVRLTRLTGGGIWAEGPVWLPDEQAVMHSDVRADRGVYWTEASGGTIWREPNDHTNGNTLDREGRVIHCEHGHRRIARTEADGTRHGLLDRYAGHGIKSPNEMVVMWDGTIWFTDPPYGIVFPDEGTPAPQEQPACCVYRFDPASGELSIATDAVVHPNGLAFSPDESLLYVTDTSAAILPDGNHHIVVLDVIDGRHLGAPRIFTVMDPGLADGLRVDERGNVWSSAGDGIHILGPDGRDIAAIRVPEVTSNCVFGGPDGRRLFITASSSLYAIETKVRGAGVAAARAARF